MWKGKILMKKFIALVLTAALGCSLFTGCTVFQGKSENEDGVYVNKKVSNEKMMSITGKEIIFKNNGLVGSEDYGYAIAKPDSWKNLSEELLSIDTKNNGTYIGYVPKSALDELNNTDVESLSAEEHMAVYDRFYEQTIPVACIYATNDEKSKEAGYMIPENYEKTERITEANGNTYYFAYNTEFPMDKKDAATLTEEDQANIKLMFDSVKELKENIILFLVEKTDDQSDFKGSLSSFEAEDMDGQKIDQSVFANYDLTMVNIWTTWCGVCVEEMPYLEKLHKQLPENVNIISICGDASDEKELAQQILNKNEITFQTLVDNDALNESLLKYVTGFPTTIFVDKNGNIVGDIQMGAPGENIVQGYQQLIDKRLAEVTNK